jgi:hypothetical protein
MFKVYFKINKLHFCYTNWIPEWQNQVQVWHRQKTVILLLHFLSLFQAVDVLELVISVVYFLMYGKEIPGKHILVLLQSEIPIH